MDPTISVVVPTHNRRDMVLDCVRSLLAQDLEPGQLEVVVVIDGSTDQTLEALAELESALSPRSHSLRVVYQPNMGANVARNVGFQKARGAFVGFVDDDELVPVAWAHESIKILDKHPEIASVGGPYRAYGRPRQKWCPKCQGGESAPMDVAGTTTVDWLFGGNHVTRKEVLERLGGFDESLRGYQEREFFRRAGALGNRFLYEPRLWVYHRGDAESLITLMSRAFKHGQGRTQFARLQGEKTNATLGQLFRYLFHGVLHWCARGPIFAAKEAGALIQRFSLHAEIAETETRNERVP